jgi:ABC-type nitrate/sulfonate/bicarbonate transport system substrate-binding protein
MKQMFRIVMVFFFNCIFILNGYAVVKQHDYHDELKTVTLLLDWKPNTNHLGFYVAKSKGYYNDEGIQIKILNPSQTTGTALVGTGNADFGISYANNLLYARNANVPIVSIAGIIQNDTSCFVWRKSLLIKNIKDLEGKRYGGWGSPEENATLKFIMQKNGADFSKIKIMTTGTQDFLPATLKNVDFTWEYKGWNILAAELNHVLVDTYCPSEHFSELNKPSPLIITSENMIKNKPELIKKFMNATSKGYEFAIHHPEEAAKLFMKQVPELDSKLVSASAKFLAPLYKADSKKWGYLNEKKFENYSNWMKKVELIDKVPNTKNYINNSFIP